MVSSRVNFVCNLIEIFKSFLRSGLTSERGVFVGSMVVIVDSFG